MKLSIKGLLALLALIITTNIKAITYYISPSGNDNAAGTSSGTAWKSITKLNTIGLVPGTVVLFEGGQTYTGRIYLDAFDGNNETNPVIISTYGSGKALIQSGAMNGLYAYNTKGIHVSNLIFEGPGYSPTTIDGIMFYTDLSGGVKLGNIQLKNIEVRNYGKSGILFYASYGTTGYKDVLIDSCHVHHARENGILIMGYTAQNHVGWSHQNVSIKHTEVDNITGYADPTMHRGSGIILGQTDNGLIESSTAHHTGMNNTHCGGPGGIWVYDSNAITVQYCESYSNSSGSGCDGLGFDLDGGVTNSVLQYNYSHNNDGAGYLLGQYDNARPWKNNIVRYNISENDGRTNAGGITLFKGANTILDGCQIYHNTVYTSASPQNANVAALSYINWSTGIENVSIYNNIFQTTGGAALVNIPAGYKAYFAGNLYWSSGANFKIAYQGTNYNSIAAWRTATGNEKMGSTATGITADPFLMSPGMSTILYPSATFSLSSYKLLPGSAAINSALNLSTFGINIGTHDFYNTNLAWANKDIGAHERPETGLATTVHEGNGVSLDLSFSPNPIPQGEHLHIRGGTPPYSVKLYSINGALAKQEENVYEHAHSIAPLVLAGGIYIVSIKDANGKEHTGKVVIP
jgi:hypothetical protein